MCAQSDEELEAALRRELPRNEKPDSCKSEAAYDKDELGAFIRSCKAAHATKVGGRPPKLFFVKIRSLGSAFTATDGVTERACLKCHEDVVEGIRGTRGHDQDVACTTCHRTVGHM